MLIVQESGGVVTDWAGAPLDFSRGRCLRENTGVVATCGGEVHALVVRACGEVLAAALEAAVAAGPVLPLTTLLSANAAFPRPTFVLLGDSITQFSFETNGWGASLASAFSRTADVVLRGFSGYNTRWVPAPPLSWYVCSHLALTPPATLAPWSPSG